MALEYVCNNTLRSKSNLSNWTHFSKIYIFFILWIWTQFVHIFWKLKTNSIASYNLHLINDVCFLISREDVGNIPCIENHTDVLHERLILDLVVRKQEHGPLTISSCFLEKLQCNSNTFIFRRGLQGKSTFFTGIFSEYI